MRTFRKIIRLGTLEKKGFYVRFAWDGARLDARAVWGPKANGNCMDAGSIWHRFVEYSQGGDHSLEALRRARHMPAGCVQKVMDIFARNYCGYSSPMQQEFVWKHHKNCWADGLEKLLRENNLNPDANGYRWGDRFHYYTPPEEYLQYIYSLPDADKAPAWI